MAKTRRARAADRDEAKTEPDVPIVAPRSVTAELDAIIAEVNAHKAVEAPLAAVWMGARLPERPPSPPGYKPPDFERILHAMGVAGKDRDRLAKSEALLQSLRQEATSEGHRRIVRETLEAFGESLGGAAGRAIAALDEWLEADEQEVRGAIRETQERLCELRAEGERLAQVLSDRQALRHARVYDTRARQAQLRHVVEFFGGADKPK